MRNILASIILLTFFGCTTPETADSLVITGVTTIDALNGAKENQTVIIRGKRIESVGSDLEIPDGSWVMDGTGKYLIPGLWDAHVHVTYESEIAPVMFKLFLVNGVTSIRDTGGLLENIVPYKEQSMVDDGNVPRLMFAGPLLDGIPTVYNGEGGRPKIGLGAGSAEEAARLVDQFAESGVDFIKSYEMLTPQGFGAVMQKSRFHKLKVTGHVPLSMDVIEASNQGLNSMEHLRNLEMSCSSDHDSLHQVRLQMLADGTDQPGGDLRSSIHSAQRYHSTQTQDPERTNEVLAALKKNNTWQIPTLTILGAWENRVFDRQEWLDDFKYLPDAVQSRWTESANQVSQTNSSSETLAFAQWGYEMIKKVDDAGIGIMAGTDTPIFFLTPGFSLHEELELLSKAGLSNLTVLESATSRPAEYFGMENELGLIAGGHYADLVLLNANPLDDIRNTKQIEAVVKSGKWHDRDDLDKMLKELEEM